MSDRYEKNMENIANTGKFMSGCAGAGCMLYLIGFVLLILFIVGLAFFSTPNPYGP